MPTAARSIHREHVEAFIAAELERTAPSSAATGYRPLQQLFGWPDEEAEVDESPMTKRRPPEDSRQAGLRAADEDVRACWRAVQARTSATGRTWRSFGCFWTPDAAKGHAVQVRTPGT